MRKIICWIWGHNWLLLTQPYRWECKRCGETNWPDTIYLKGKLKGGIQEG